MPLGRGPGMPRFYRPGRMRDWLGSITAAHGKAEKDLLTTFYKELSDEFFEVVVEQHDDIPFLVHGSPADGLDLGHVR